MGSVCSTTLRPFGGGAALWVPAGGLEHDRAMRIGLQIPNFTIGVPDDQLFEAVAQQAVTAEESGFESLWVMDHFYQLPALGGPTQPMLESYTLLGGLAARTSRIMLGTMVTGVTYRNPALLAKIVTTLDVISAGRAMLGIGAAWYDVEHEGLGVEFPPAGERLDRLEEAVQICRAMFRDDVVTFEGRYYSVHEARNLPRPVQPGGPPILIGGGGEKRTLRLVAQYADYCNIFGDEAAIRHKVAVLHEHCEAVGRDPASITVSRLATLVITDTAEESRATLELLGSIEGMEPGAFNVGTEDEIVAQLEELAAAGVEYFIFNMPTSGADAVRRAGGLLAARLTAALSREGSACSRRGRGPCQPRAPTGCAAPPRSTRSTPGGRACPGREACRRGPPRGCRDRVPPPLKTARSVSRAAPMPAPPMGIHPSAYSAIAANSRGPAPPPTSVRTRGCCTGLGHENDGGSDTCTPWNSASSCDHSACMHRTFSRATARRTSKSTPWSAASSRFQPYPMPSTKRPPDRRSRVAICLARTMGSCWATSVTPVPSRMRSVTAAAAASDTKGSRLRL